MIPPAKHLFSVVAAAIIVTGCASELKSRHFQASSVIQTEETAKKGGTQLSGIPFTLNKPQMTLTYAPETSSAPEAYILKIDYVPDPDNQFTLQIDPNLLSNVDFSMTYDDKGGLTGVSAKTTDQSVAVIASLGKLAVGLAGFADTSGTAKDPATKTIDVVDAAIKERTPFVDPEGDRHGPRSLNSDEVAAWPRLRERLLLAQARGNGTIADFFYLDKRERNLFLAARAQLEREGKAYGTRFDPNQPLPACYVPKGPYKDTDSKYADLGIDQAKAPDWRRIKIPASPGDDVDAANGKVNAKASAGGAEKAAAIDDAMRSYDIAKLATIRQVLEKKDSTNRKLLERKALEGKASDEDLQAFWDTRELLKLAAMAQAEIDDACDGGAKLIASVAFMTWSEWQVRRVTELNKEIDARRDFDRLPAQTPANASTIDNVYDSEIRDKVLNGMLRRKAAMIGMLSEYDDLVRLKGRLESGRVDDRHDPAIDTLIATLQKRLADAEAQLKPADKKPESPVVVDVVRITEADKADIPKAVRDAFRSQRRRPTYAIVIKPAPNPGRPVLLDTTPAPASPSQTPATPTPTATGNNATTTGVHP